MGKTITTLEIFAEEITKAIKARIDVEIDVKKVEKNNGLKLTGICIKGTSNCCPMIYLEQFFEKYQNGSQSINEIVDTLISINDQYKMSDDFDMSFFFEWDTVKDSIKAKLINGKANKDLLSEVPHIIFGDLVVVFRVIFNSSKLGNGSITIRNEHMDKWGKTTQDLYDAAMTNRDEVIVKSMVDTLREMMGVEADEMFPELESDGPTMWVCSNLEKVFGSIALIMFDKLHQFGTNLGDNFFIIPSSTHELLFIPAKEVANHETLDEMIQDVNATQLAPDEVLSDHAYYYETESGTLFEQFGGNKIMMVIE